MKESKDMRIASLAVVASMLLAAPAASAHVTVQPSSAPADGYARLDVRVPNERDDSATVKVDVQLPPGVFSASYEPLPGWSVKVARERLDEPLETKDGFAVDEQITRISWTGSGRDGRIGPGEFRDFPLSLRLPAGKAGDRLAFKALQTYDDGEVVRWIGPADADEPAPTVTLQSAAAGGGHGAPAATGAGPTAESGNEAQPPSDHETDEQAETSGVAIAALILAGLGLAAAIAALVTVRRQATAKEQAR